MAPVSPTHNGHSSTPRGPRFPWQLGCGVPLAFAVVILGALLAFSPGWKAQAEAAEPAARQFLRDIAQGQTDAALQLTTPQYRRQHAEKELNVLAERWSAELGADAQVALTSTSAPPLSFGREANLVFEVRGRSLLARALVYLKKQNGGWSVDSAALRQVVR